MHYIHTATTGHLGIGQTIERVKLGFFWVGIKIDVRRFCRKSPTNILDCSDEPLKSMLDPYIGILQTSS